MQGKGNWGEIWRWVIFLLYFGFIDLLTGSKRKWVRVIINSGPGYWWWEGDWADGVFGLGM